MSSNPRPLPIIEVLNLKKAIWTNSGTQRHKLFCRKRRNRRFSWAKRSWQKYNPKDFVRTDPSRLR
jgi:hypothetical protein